MGNKLFQATKQQERHVVSNQGGVDVAGGQEDAVTITEFAAMLVQTEVSE